MTMPFIFKSSVTSLCKAIPIYLLPERRDKNDSEGIVAVESH
jgi:hypothetical protein